MLYREKSAGFSLDRLLLRLVRLFDSRQRRRHRRRVELDLLALSPYLQRDIGIPDDSPILPRIRGR